jgi:decaprenylphospho-beta-D-ribofuranose 2-oxidase
MPITIDDLPGLNQTTVKDMPLVADMDALNAVIKSSQDEGVTISVAGTRHSQGGHTMGEGHRVINLTTGITRLDAPQVVTNQAWAATVTVDAGATWSQLHHVLAPMGFAPMVQQSSAGFSIGGSISVNCHGRDPRWGPISQSVESLEVHTPQSGLMTASRTTNPDLFWATLGGYGACGVIQRATLRVVKDEWLVNAGDDRGGRSVAEYLAHAHGILNGKHPNVHLHYGWMNCVPGPDFLNEVLIADYTVGTPPNDGAAAQAALYEEKWGQSELLRAGWCAAREHPDIIRPLVWRQLKERHQFGNSAYQGKGTGNWRTNWLRSSTSFTNERPPNHADILQEYFLPLDQLVAFLNRAKSILRNNALGHVNVLNVTLRLVKQDNETLLSYCNDGPMVCVALDASVPVNRTFSGARDISAAAKSALLQLQEAAVDRQGGFYLPYYALADKALLTRAYPRWTQFMDIVERYNPSDVHGRRALWSKFLAAYA